MTKTILHYHKLFKAFGKLKESNEHTFRIYNFQVILNLQLLQDSNGFHENS